MARIAVEKGESIAFFIPFLRESTVKAYAFKAFERGGMDKVTEFLPFMNETDVLELMKLASQTNG